MQNLIAMPEASGSDNIEPIWSELFEEESLQEKASTLWHLVVTEMKKVDTFAIINTFEVKRYVVYTLMYDRAIAKAFKDEPVIECRSKNDLRFNPWWTVAKDCDSHAMIHEHALGLSPNHRAKVAIAKKGKTASKADEFLGAKRAS